MLPSPLSPDAVKYEVAVVPINFRRDHEPVPGKPGEYREVHKVDLVKKGSNGASTPWTIKALQKETILWPVIKPYYEAWLSGQEEPAEGTPIDVLPFITPGQVQHLRNLHIRSAQDLAKCTDADLERIGMGARMMREKARAYVQASEGDAKIAAANAEMKATIEQQAAQIAELMAQVNTLMADKPKRDRPGDFAKRQ